jgi:N-methylhydantoinase A
MSAQNTNSNWVIGVDVGGTFTDFYALERRSGRVCVHKTSSTPDNPAKAIISGLDELARAHGVELPAMSRLAHGTTTATNTLIQRKGGTVAVITTRGFRDLLEIGRQVRPRMYDLRLDYPAPLAKRQHRFEITERIGPEGEIITPLADTELEGLAAAIKASGAQACAVCLLFAYLNPVHEKCIAEYLRRVVPGLHVSLSSEVQPEFREYERFSTTLLNAYLQPVLADYMSHLSIEVERRSPGARVGINQSSGGLMSVARAREFPIRTALSGPASGAVGAIYMARLSNLPRAITLDMGGTSADVAVIRDFDAGTCFNREIASFPVRLPMVDINSVGAGGGSIAWFDLDGLLKVGPRSAGADPGPACYGRGGTEPTVTDANVVLGRLSARGLLGGAMALNVEASHSVIAPVATRLGLSPERTAEGILDIVTANMVRAIRNVTVERGHDPRGFTLLAFGGAGSLMATAVARSLGIREVLVPLSPGILCAQGLVVADLKEGFVQSKRMALNEASYPGVQLTVDQINSAAMAWFVREGVDSQSRRLNLSFDMRYVGQNFELNVPIPFEGSTAGLATPEELRTLFFRAHEMSYGFFNPEAEVEIINFRLVARGVVSPPPAPAEPPGGSKSPQPIERRSVWFDGQVHQRTPVFRRDHMARGCTFTGPLIVDQFDATTAVYPGDTVKIDEAMNLFIKLK